MKQYTWNGYKVLELKLPFCKQPICVMSLSNLLALDKKMDDLVDKVCERSNEHDS